MTATAAPVSPVPRDVSGYAGPLIDGLIDLSAQCHARGWSLGTSSNFSALVSRDPFVLLITASGRDKRSLTGRDFVLVDAAGKPLRSDDPRPSAETLIHATLASRTGVGSVIGTHSVWATLLSDLHADAGRLIIAGYEMLKGLEGIGTHESIHYLPVLPNTQDMPALAADLRRLLDEPGSLFTHGFLLRNHGLYTWGKDLATARRHAEIYEFLFEVIGRQMMIQRA